MAFFTARILSKDGIAITEDIEVWMHFFRHGHVEMWAGSCEVPVTTPLTQRTYRLQLTDGRAGRMTAIVTQLRGENLAVYFEGKGALG